MKASAKVLVVDDDPQMRVGMGASLAEYDVTLVDSAAKALACMARNSFDVILCDLVMPGMTGAELYGSLGQDSPMQRRFIFTTGGALPVGIASFVALCSVPVLQKPFGVAQLREAVAVVLAETKFR